MPGAGGVFHAADLRSDELDQVTPSAINALVRAARSPASTPSVTSTPTLRPAKVLGPFLHDAQGPPKPLGPCLVGFAAAVAGLPASSFNRKPLATVSASLSVDVQEVRNHLRARMGTVSTLLSSNTKAFAICSLLQRGLADIELPGLAVMVGRRFPNARGSSGPSKPASGYELIASVGAFHEGRHRSMSWARSWLSALGVVHRHMAILLEVGERDTSAH